MSCDFSAAAKFGPTKTLWQMPNNLVQKSCYWQHLLSLIIQALVATTHGLSNADDFPYATSLRDILVCTLGLYLILALCKLQSCSYNSVEPTGLKSLVSYIWYILLILIRWLYELGGYELDDQEHNKTLSIKNSDLIIDIVLIICFIKSIAINLGICSIIGNIFNWLNTPESGSNLLKIVRFMYVISLWGRCCH